MGKVVLDMAMSLDGFVAGPNGEDAGLHDWFFPPSGGRNAVDEEVVRESISTTGAIVMGRRAYDQGASVGGFSGTPYRVPHFVLSHGDPEEAPDGTPPFTFFSGRVEDAVGRARTVAGDGNVVVGGGADVARQALGAGIVEEVAIHLVPVLLGGGTRLFGESGGVRMRLQRIGTVESPFATHLRFRVPKGD